MQPSLPSAVLRRPPPSVDASSLSRLRASAMSFALSSFSRSAFSLCFGESNREIRQSQDIRVAADGFAVVVLPGLALAVRVRHFMEGFKARVLEICFVFLEAEDVLFRIAGLGLAFYCEAKGPAVLLMKLNPEAVFFLGEHLDMFFKVFGMACSSAVSGSPSFNFGSCARRTVRHWPAMATMWGMRRAAARLLCWRNGSRSLNGFLQQGYGGCSPH